MINVLLMTLCIAAGSMQNIFRKPYTNRFGGKGTYLFNAFTTGAAAIFFAATSGGLVWEPAILPYVLLFAISYATTTIFFMLALSCGPLSLSSLILSFSTIIPTLYGLLLGEPIRYATFLPGLLLLLVSLFLTNKPQKNEKISAKWLIFIALAALGNGGCSVFQTMQQVAFHEQYKNELMVLSLAMITLFFLAMSFLTEHKEMKTYLKGSWHLGSLCGIFNALLNLLVMVLRPVFGAAILFPLYSGGSLVLTFLIASVFYKEKLNRWQLLGFILGIGSVVLLSI